MKPNRHDERDGSMACARRERGRFAVIANGATSSMLHAVLYASRAAGQRPPDGPNRALCGQLGARRLGSREDGHVTERFWEIFFEVYEPLPRQGPGNRASAQRALELCRGLPASPSVLDLGCGSGAQTRYLVELTDGHITAVDNHAPNIARLQAFIEEQGLSDRIEAVVGDMSRPTFAPQSIDLLWSEGALYNIGVPAALELYADVVRPGGYLVFTDAVWLTPDAPAEVKATFEDYPSMGSVADCLRTIEESDWTLVDHFPLPEEAWWDDFYTPMERQIDTLRGTHAGDAEALGILDELAKEPPMYRAHGSTFGYEFFVLRR
jgi:SAM-dependent methyltransferase